MHSGAGERGSLRDAGVEQSVLKAVVTAEENGASCCRVWHCSSVRALQFRMQFDDGMFNHVLKMAEFQRYDFAA